MSPGSGGASRTGRETALAALFFLAATILMTWPQAIHLGDAMTDLWDAKLNARILQWDYHQTVSDPRRLFDLNFFHPAQDVLAFSENLWGVSLFGWPLLALGASPLVNYNVLFLLGMFLSALSAWGLARYVTGDALASVVAGIVYAFLPWRLSQLPHLQHQWGGFLCLLLLFLLRYLDLGKRRDLTLFTLFFAWNALSNVHYAVFSGLLVPLVLGFQWVEKGEAVRARVFAAAAAVVAGGLAFVPFALAYRRAERLYGMHRYLGEMLFYSGKWSYFLSAGILNRFWGPITSPWRAPEGDFFPGCVALGLAVAALVKVRRAAQPASMAVSTMAVSPRRRTWVRVLDALIGASAAVGIAAILVPGLRVGRVSVGDPGRVLVFWTALVAVRLLIAFPKRSAYTSAGDWLRRSRVPPKVVLFAAVSVLGVLVALGGHTPYYRFLFQSLGGVFRSIRAPSRGIVLFDLGLGVLASWGLAVWLQRRPGFARSGWMAVTILALGIEYHGFPLRIRPVEAQAAPVYAWLAKDRTSGAVVEWPLGLEYDFEYIFRQAQHGRDLVNGYSGFFPEPYLALQAMVKRRPIPDAVWDRLEGLGVRLVVYHSHETRGIAVVGYASALDRAVTAGRFELVGSFPHEGGLDFVLAATSPSGANAPIVATEAAAARQLFHETSARLLNEGMRLSPPFGYLDAPGEAQTVSPGDWAFGWALDDSGIADVRAEIETGPVPVSVHLPREGLERLYPDYPESDRGGFAFRVPALAPGPHRLLVTFVAKDGGTKRIERTFRIDAGRSAEHGISNPSAAARKR